MEYSELARKLMNIPAFSPYMRDGCKYSENPWCEEHPERVMNISCAENVLTWPAFKTKFNEFSTLHASDNMYAVSSSGRRYMRQAMADFMTKEVFQTQVKPEEITFFSGSGASMDALGTSFFNKGDAYIVITPGFVKFCRDMSLRNGSEMYRADTSKNNFRISEEILEDVYRAATEEGHPVKMLIVTNPNNPTGLMYTEAELRMMLRWCRKYNIHLFSDEIYALSVKPKRLREEKDTKFISYAKIIESDPIKDDVTVLWGLSKDFGLSGFRFSLLWSRNELLQKAFNEFSHFMEVSSVCQSVCANMFSDKPFLEQHVSTLREKVWSGRQLAESFFDALDVTHVKGEGGFFVWFNLGKFLNEKTFEAEEELYNFIYEHGKVIVCPGKSFFSSEPGWYRMVFTCYEQKQMLIGLNRLATAIYKRAEIMGIPQPKWEMPTLCCESSEVSKSCAVELIAEKKEEERPVKRAAQKVSSTSKKSCA